MVACRAGNRNAVELLLPKLTERQINMRGRPYAMDGGETPLTVAVYHSGCDHASETLGIVEAVRLCRLCFLARCGYCDYYCAAVRSVFRDVGGTSVVRRA